MAQGSMGAALSEHSNSEAEKPTTFARAVSRCLSPRLDFLKTFIEKGEREIKQNAQMSSV